MGNNVRAFTGSFKGETPEQELKRLRRRVAELESERDGLVDLIVRARVAVWKGPSGEPAPIE